MRQTETLLVALAASSAALAAAAQNRNAASPDAVSPVSPQTQVVQAENPADTEFLLDALRASKAEVRMGELAEQRGGSVAVREYGKKLKDDHANVVRELTLLLEPLNMNVPTEPTAEEQTHYAALAQLSGTEFDAAFVPLMLEAHHDAIEMYGAQTHANPNAEIADFAAEHLPSLREHLAIAESLERGLPGHWPAEAGPRPDASER